MFEPEPLPLVSLTAVETIRNNISHLFSPADTTLDWPEPGQFRLRGQFLRDTAESFDELRAIFEQQGYTPLIRLEANEPVLIGVPIVFQEEASNWIINLILFIVTVFSTMLVGALGEVGDYRLALQNLWLGLPFSISLLLILGAHELGHYFAARYHRVPVTLPYFIPMPLSIIGTMGAFIRLKAPVKNKRALFDVGAAGPLVGLVFAIPILLYGLSTSEVGPLPDGGYIMEGNSLLYAAAKFLVLGEVLPAGGIDVSLNQIAWAGWVGLLVTGLNLIPLGQLDGGHVAYVLFGKRAKRLFWPVLLLMGALALATGATMWFVWIVLLFFIGRAHAEPLDDVTALDPRRRYLAIFTMLLFFLVFVPVPLQVIVP